MAPSDGWIPNNVTTAQGLSGGEVPCLPQREPSSSEACWLLERNVLEHKAVAQAHVASLYLARGPEYLPLSGQACLRRGGPRGALGPVGLCSLRGQLWFVGAPELSLLLVWTSVPLE